MAISTLTARAANFTDKDLDSWILFLRALARATFPTWTDFNKANAGNLLLELFAHTLDSISYTQDQQHRETRISWAQLRRSMIHLGRLAGFKLPTAVAATVDLEITFAVATPLATDVIFPKGTVVKTVDLAENIEFDLTADATIPAGQIQVTTAASENSREQVEAFVADGSPNQAFQLAAVPYLDGSVITVIAAVTWEEKDSFLNSGPTDKHFTVEVDERDRGRVVFGDGINGEKPTGAITFTFRIGGGEVGNVEANKLVEFRDGNRFPSLDGTEVSVTVRNPIKAAGGADRMTVEEARVAIPASFATVGGRSVTQDDFENNALKDRGVARAMMLTSDDDPSIPENTGELYVMPVGGGLPSAALKTSVLALFLPVNIAPFPPTITFILTIEDPGLKIIPVTATVLLQPGVSEPDARTAIETDLAAYFSLLTPAGGINDQIDFGFKIRKNKMPAATAVALLPFSDIISVIADARLPSGAKAIRSVDEDTLVPADDVTILDTEFPTLGTILLTNSDTSGAF